MLKWLIIVAAGYFLFRMLTNDKKHKDENAQEERENLIASGDLVKDPSCGAFIEKDSAISVRDGEKVYLFCSYECRDAFLQKRSLAESPEEIKVEHEEQTAEPTKEQTIDHK